MAVAALTPRVRTIVICDDVTVSPTEDSVFTLEGVRFHLATSSFPCRKTLNSFLLISSSRKGTYSGKVLVVNERTDKTIRYAKFQATLEHDRELLALGVDLGDCVFPEPGQYNFGVYFSAQGGDEALKGEHPFTVLSYEE
jgi:hypothetical protein